MAKKMVRNRSIAVVLLVVLFTYFLPFGGGPSGGLSVPFSVKALSEPVAESSDAPPEDSAEEPASESPEAPPEDYADGPADVPVEEPVAPTEIPEDTPVENPPQTAEEIIEEPASDLPAVSPQSQGYALILQNDTPVRERPNSGDQPLTLLSKGDVVFVAKRVAVDAEQPDKDWLLCFFDTDQGMQKGYVRANHISFADESGQAKWVEKIRQSGSTAQYEGHPLMLLDCELLLIPIGEKTKEVELTGVQGPAESFAVQVAPLAVTQADDEADYEYSIYGPSWAEEVTITKYKGNAASVSVPATLGGNPVVAIYGAFRNNPNLQFVSIPEGVTGISDESFDGCSELLRVDLPNGVKTIGLNAFRNCGKLVSINLPVTVASIGSRAFQNCASLPGINIPSGVKYINPETFKGCANLTVISLPQSILVIDSYAFEDCTNLTEINLTAGLTQIGWRAFAGCIKLSGISLPSGFTTIEGWAFYNCTSLTDLSLPSSLTGIGTNAFYNCTSLRSAHIPSGVTRIDGAAFYNCKSLSDLSLPEGLIHIDDSAFFGCSSLTAVDLPSTLTSIGRYAFIGCANLTAITIPAGITLINFAVFSECTKLASVSIPHTVTSIDPYAFRDCPLQKIYGYTGTYAETYALSKGIAFEGVPMVGITSINLNKTYLLLPVMASVSLTADIQPANATAKQLAWTSSDPSVAFVSDKGSVTAVGAGTAIIKATDSYGGIVFGECTVRVADQIRYVSEIKLDRTDLMLYIGRADALTAAVLPEDANEKALCWTSGDESIVTVDAQGNLTAVGVGMATVTAAAIDGSEEKAVCTVSVMAPVMQVSLDQTSLTLYTGETAALRATALPETATDKQILWHSSDESVATVDDSGNVTAVKAGDAMIMATAQYGEDVYESCTVSVLQYVSGITLDQDDVKLNVGQSAQLAADVLPDDATNKELLFHSSDETIAVVDQTGKITAVRQGNVTITAMAKDGSGVFAQCAVSIVQYVTQIDLDEAFLTLHTGETASLAATVLPDDATDKEILWTSSDEGIATVDGDGKVMAVKVGNATITATAKDGNGAYADCTVSVLQYVTEITLSQNAASLNVGTAFRLTADILPIDASDKDILWTSSNESIATVDAAGNVTAVKEGSATIMAAAKDGGGAYAQCAVSVLRYVTEINLNKASITLHISETETLLAAILPDDATSKALLWTSSDEGIATVNASGEVTAHKAGTAIITAAAQDGSGISAACKVTVKQLVTQIAFNKTEETVYTGQTLPLSFTVSPQDASDKRLAFSSSDETVTTVSASGVVAGHKAGTATITAAAQDGSGISAACVVTVRQHVTGIVLSKAQATLYTGETLSLSAAVSPDNAHDKRVVFSSSDASVAAVSAEGVVTARKAGTATLTASAQDGSGISAACVVTVRQRVTGMALNNTAKTLYAGETFSLLATVAPADASDKRITYSSTDESIAAVSAVGVITGRKAGTATITAAAQDGSGISASCVVTVVQHVTGIVLNMTKETLYIGQTLPLLATVSPDNAPDKRVTFSSSDETIAAVNAAGVVTAYKTGTATITASAQDGSGKQAACVITVIARISSIQLDPTAITIAVNQSVSTVNATVLPADAENTTLLWTSSNPSVATVDENGRITGQAPGQAVVTASAQDGSEQKASVSVTVVKAKKGVTSIKLSKTSATILENKKLTLKAKLSPSSPTNKTVRWSSSDPAVATVSAKGVVVGVRAGTATITAVASSGYTAECVVKVNEVAVSKVKMKKSSASLTIGGTIQLAATVSPSNARDKSLTWSSSNTDVAEVSESGRVTAVAPGTATIWATSANGRRTTCKIKVKPVYVKSISIQPGKKASVQVPKGEALPRELILDATVRPSNATNTQLSWKSSNPRVATVDEEGVVTCVGYGKATITASAKDGSKKKATCLITVTAGK